jgi:hypothetical protein
MAKSDLLKEAIADAKAVKETALANAKLALQEEFVQRMEKMLATKLSEELADDEMDDMAEPAMDDMAEPAMDDMAMDDEGMDMDMPDSIGVGIDLDNDGEYDYEGDLPQPGEEGMEDLAGMEGEEGMEDMAGEEGMEDMAGEEDDLDLAEIIAELEEGMYEEEGKDVLEDGIYEMDEPGVPMDADAKDVDASIDEDIDSLIEAILSEEEEDDKDCPDCGKTMKEGKCNCNEAMKEDEKKEEEELKEAYRTVRHLKSVINEVNLLNAKLLYTNKLFRNFELNESQKMKVIENFDRAATTREAKLVFSTLAESFKRPTAGKKKVVKESKSYASRPTRGTAPSQQTTQILNEGFEYANRWKKLAGLL